MISVKNLDKWYGDLRAVSNVSFEVARGEVVGLLGQNGAGKTTMMKILTGYLEATGGQASVDGVDVMQDRLGVQRQIGYLPENAPSYPEMLVQEYLVMMAELRGLAKTEIPAAVADAARSTGLADRLIQPIGTLSKGYRQRVGLAQAIVHRPELLVLDEPTNGLDPVQILEIRTLIRKLAEHSTVILSTHILSEIEAVCGRVLILIDGELTTDASLSDLLASERIMVSLRKGAGAVAETLKGIDEVTAVERLGDDPDHDQFERWAVTAKSPVACSTGIVRAAAARGWEVAAVAPATSSLEEVFRNQMRAHAERQGVKAEVAL